MDESPKKRKLDSSILAAIIGSLVVVAGAILVFWTETQQQDAVIIERIPWIEHWLDTREKRTNDTIRRVEKIESVLMEDKK